LAETDDNPTDSHHTVHDVFRFLIDVRGLAPFVAKKEVLEKLQLDRLHVDLHIRGGARSRNSGGAEAIPPKGATFPVHPESWGAGKILDLSIRDGELVVTPECGLDYSWDAYSFTVPDWSNALSLWPAPVSATLPSPIRIEIISTPSAATPASDTNTAVPNTVTPTSDVSTSAMPPAPSTPLSETAPGDTVTAPAVAEKLKSIPPNTMRHWVLSKMAASPGRIWEADFAETLMALCPIEDKNKKTIQTCLGEFRKLFGTRPPKK
jgi:hypothetical protein